MEWGAETKTIKAGKGDVVILLPLDGKEVMINDEILELEVPAKLVNGRTLVPLRFVSEALGCDVHWDASVSLVRITYNSKVLDLPPLPPNEQIPVVLDLTKIPKGQGEITITHGQYLFP